MYTVYSLKMKRTSIFELWRLYTKVETINKNAFLCRKVIKSNLPN